MLTAYIAKEFITWLQATFPERFISRDQAVGFAQELLSEGEIKHSAGKTKFADGHYFYVFNSVGGFIFSYFLTLDVCRMLKLLKT